MSSSAASRDEDGGKLDCLIPEYLWICGWAEAQHVELLRAAEITHVLTVGGGMKPLYTEEFSYQVIEGIDDTEDAVIIERFDESFSFFELVKKSDKGKLLVHCEGGVSRSATICAAYMMKTFSLTMDETLQRMQAIRPVVSPNPGFRKQLQLFFDCNYVVDTAAVAEYVEEQKKILGGENPKDSAQLQTMFDELPKNYNYEVSTSEKADNFVETILETTLTNKRDKKLRTRLHTSDDQNLAKHKPAPSIPVAENDSGVPNEERKPVPGRSLSPTPVSAGLMQLSEEASSGGGNLSSGRSSPLSATLAGTPRSPKQHQRARDDIESSISNAESSRTGNVRRFRTASSGADCSNANANATVADDGDTLEDVMPTISTTTTNMSFKAKAKLRSNSSFDSSSSGGGGGGGNSDEIGAGRGTLFPRHDSAGSTGSEAKSEKGHLVGEEASFPPEPPSLLPDSSSSVTSAGSGSIAGTAAPAPAPPPTEQAPKDTSEPVETEKATKVVGKVLLGYAMTPADERVVTQWLASEPAALSGGSAFKGLRQALRMMRSFSNDTADDHEKNIEALSSVKGLWHSLEHVSTILEQFTGFPLHSVEFMRLLQSDDKLDTILAKLETDFSTALKDMRRYNSSSDDSAKANEEGEEEEESDDPPLIGGGNAAGSPIPENFTLEEHLPSTPTSESGPILSSSKSFAASAGRKRSKPLLGLPLKPPLKPPPKITVVAEGGPALDNASFEAGGSAVGQNHTSLGPRKFSEGLQLLKKGGTGQLKRASRMGDTGAGKPAFIAHGRRRSATIDLLLLLSKLGLRRDDCGGEISDRLYHSLSQFLEGGSKEVKALQSLDQNSAIELLGYLESFPDTMKKDPRVSRLGLICKARLILMVAIDTVDEICDELLSPQRGFRVTGHVRDVVTYCLNFRGALIGTHFNLVRREKEAREKEDEERKAKAAAIIQAWKRRMREEGEKHNATPPINRIPPAICGSRSRNLRAWNTSSSTAEGVPAAMLANMKPIKHYNLFEARRGAADRDRRPIQSTSVVSSINLVLTSTHGGSDFPVRSHHRNRTTSRTTLAGRPQLIVPPTTHNYWTTGGARGRDGNKPEALVDAKAAFSTLKSSPPGPGQAENGASQSLNKLSGADSNSSVSSSQARRVPRPLGISDFASVTSSNSIANSAFYLSNSSDKLSNPNSTINPIHAMQGILRHLSRVVVTEARMNMASAYPQTQKLKSLQGFAKQLKHVHPRVCVADKESRPGLQRLPKASKELTTYIKEHKFGVNQTPYCFDYKLGVLCFFPPCELDTALQPPNDPSAVFRAILSTVFDLMPVEMEALDDLTETSVFSQHAAAGYALTTTLRYVDKFSQTTYLFEHHLGDETQSVSGSVTGGYLHYDKENERYIFTEESGHYGLRWTLPGTRQSLDEFMQNCENDLGNNYVLKPFHRQTGEEQPKLADLFDSVAGDPEEGRDGGQVESNAGSKSTEAHVDASQVPAVQEVEPPEWDFD